MPKTEATTFRLAPASARQAEFLISLRGRISDRLPLSFLAAPDIPKYQGDLIWFVFVWNGLKTLVLAPLSLYWLAKTKITALTAHHRTRTACDQARGIADTTTYESFTPCRQAI